MSPRLTTPIALIIFNRPDTTARVFAEIARARPSKLLIVADGPRSDHPADAEKCARTRAIVKQVDWECEVLTEYSAINLGSKMRPVTGINWVFEQVEGAIILEDDCLPHPSFFPFCQELLETYRDDPRVMMVSGLNLMGEWRPGPQSYFFSALGGTWGWATWRRAWRHFDPEIKVWPQALESQVVEKLFPNPRYSSYWKDVLQKVYDGTITTAWDYQWLLACWLQNAWRIVPQVNLIKNLGFGPDATHHQLEDDPLARIPVKEMDFPLKHPAFMVRDEELDEELSRAFYSPTTSPNVLYRLKNRVMRTLSDSR